MVLGLDPCLDVAAAVAQLQYFRGEAFLLAMVSALPAQTRSGKMLDGAASWLQISVRVRLAFLAYVDMLYGRLELRFGPLSQQGPEEARHWFPRLDFLFSAALSRNDEVLHCGTALSANPSSGSDYDISSVPLWTWRV